MQKNMVLKGRGWLANKIWCLKGGHSKYYLINSFHSSAKGLPEFLKQHFWGSESFEFSGVHAPEPPTMLGIQQQGLTHTKNLVAKYSWTSTRPSLRLLQTFAGLYWSIFLLVKKINVREAQVCILWTLGVVLFHWLAAFKLTHSSVKVWYVYKPLEGKNSLIFQENPFSLNELIGSADLMVFHEIWSEHSLIDMEQRCVGEFVYFKYFLSGGL